MTEVRDQKSEVSINDGHKSMSKKIMLFALCSVLLAPRFSVQAQQPAKVRKVGVLRADSPPNLSVETFQQAMRDIGYVEGKNIFIEYRYAEGKVDRLPNLAEELVRLNVDVIWALGPAVAHAKNATKTIPIVITHVGDPVGSGLVASLARPGGNITGLSSLAPEMSGKRLELLKEIVPKLVRVVVLGQSSNAGNAPSLKETELAARTFGVQLQYSDIRNLKDIENAFQEAHKGRADAVLMLGGPVLNDQRKVLAELAVKNRLPTISSVPEFVEDGGLMTYAVSVAANFRRAAVYVDKILKGAKPAELPVEQPTKFELVINLKTAKQIGLTIPPNVLARADRVIK
jgi:putative ABC transport system substrate-binding protein